MISCKSVIDNLSSYIDGELSSRFKSDIEDHIAQCHKCSSVYNNAAIVKRHLNGMTKLQTSGAFEVTLRSRIALDQERRRTIFEGLFDSFPGVSKKPIIGFAAAAVGVALFLMINNDNISDKKFYMSGQNTQEENVLLPNKGQNQTVDRDFNNLADDKPSLSATPVGLSDSTEKKYTAGEKPHYIDGNIQYINK